MKGHLRKLKRTWIGSVVCYRFWPHLMSFGIPLVILIAILIVAANDVPWKLSCLSVLMVVFVVLLLLFPMNVIYSLIGTRGNPRVFFFMFLIINSLFSCVYYWGYFKNAGITYDLNQPHVEFNIFENHRGQVDLAVTSDSLLLDSNTVYYACVGEYLPKNCDTDIRYYHKISYKWVLQNTLLTSFMQEPSGFFSIASVYSGNHDRRDKNIEMAKSFHWFLVFHILISWIFLGVFISLIYQKVRNNN